MNHLPIAKEAILNITVMAAVSLLLYYLFPPLSLLGLLLILFVVFFFRNPHRRVPEGDHLIVSPADGKILAIEEIHETGFIQSRAVKISIFLSIFNVHINRSPIQGTVSYITYQPGKYMPAYKKEAPGENERNYLGIEGDIKVIVCQIAGLIARRIVCWVKESDRLMTGQRFGLIKFGSCTQIIVPASVELKVKVGDKVKGGISIIGVMH